MNALIVDSLTRFHSAFLGLPVSQISPSSGVPFYTLLVSYSFFVPIVFIRFIGYDCYVVLITQHC